MGQSGARYAEVNAKTGKFDVISIVGHGEIKVNETDLWILATDKVCIPSLSVQSVTGSAVDTTTGGTEGSSKIITSGAVYDAIKDYLSKSEGGTVNGSLYVSTNLGIDTANYFSLDSDNYLKLRLGEGLIIDNDVKINGTLYLGDGITYVSIDDYIDARIKVAVSTTEELITYTNS